MINIITILQASLGLLGYSKQIMSLFPPIHTLQYIICYLTYLCIYLMNHHINYQLFHKYCYFQNFHIGASLTIHNKTNDNYIKYSFLRWHQCFYINTSDF